MTAFAPLLGLLEEVPDHRRAEGKVYQLAHVLLFSILAIVSGGNSYRSIVTFIEMHRHRLSDAVEAAFRRHASLLQAAHAKPGGGSLAIDGKTLRGSFDGFRDRAAAHLLGVFATDTALVLAHSEVDEKSNEIPAAQALLAELGLAGHLLTLDALHCQRKPSTSPPRPEPT